MRTFTILLCLAALALHVLAGQEPNVGAVVAEESTPQGAFDDAAKALPPMPPLPEAKKAQAPEGTGAVVSEAVQVDKDDKKTKAAKADAKKAKKADAKKKDDKKVKKKGNPIFRDLPKIVENPKLKTDAKKDVDKKKKKEEGGEKEEEGPKGTIEIRNLWAFLGIITFLLVFTIIFENLKDYVVEAVHASPNQPIVSAIFSELTVLGFLAFIAFLLTKFGLGHISLMVYGHADVEEDKMKLQEMLEQIHMVIFIMMCIFIMQALGMLVFSARCARRWTAAQSRILKQSERVKLVQAFHDIKQNNMPSWFERNFLAWFGRAKEYFNLQDQVQFMLVRQEFRYDEKAFTQDAENPSGTALDRDFAFSLYLKKIMGQRLAEIVELPMLQWIFLEIFVAIVLTTTVIMGGSWPFLLWLCQAISWLTLLFVILFRNKLNSVYYHLANDRDGVGILNNVSSDDVAVDVAGDGASQAGSGTGSGAGSAPVTEATPLQQSAPTLTPRSKLREEYPPEIRDDMPRFLTEDLPVAGSCIPKCMKDESSDPAQQKMYDLFWFGKNEVSFHRAAIRFNFLTLAVQMSIFLKQILPNYILITYSFGPACLMTITGILPGVLIYFKYIFEVIKLSVIVTSVESMRNRRMVSRVVRHQKEERALLMLRLVVAMQGGEIREEDRPNAETMEYLATSADNSFLVEKMGRVFADIDVDGSGQLDRTEMTQVFKRFGITCDDKKIASIMSNMSSDGNTDEIHKAEFVSWLVNKERQAREMDPEEFAHKCFEFLDTEGDVGLDGKPTGGDHVLTISELQAGLHRINGGTEFDFNEVAAMVLELDMNDDNELSVEEFARWIELQDADNMSPEEINAINSSSWF